MTEWNGTKILTWEASEGLVSGQPRQLAARDAERFVRDELCDPGRGYPVVGVSTRTRGTPWLDVRALARELGRRARVVVLGTPDATYAVQHQLGYGLEVYGGSLRLWWPGLEVDSNSWEHPLIVVRSELDAERAPAILESRLARPLEPLGAAVAQASDDDGKRPEAGSDAERDGGADRPVGEAPDGNGAAPDGAAALPAYDVPTPDPIRRAWEQLDAIVAEGDVVRGRVVAVGADEALVALLPGVPGIIPRSEYSYSRDPGDDECPTVGQLVKASVLYVDVLSERAELSLRRAWGRGEPSDEVLAQLDPDPVGAGVGAVERQLEERIERLERTNGAQAGHLDRQREQLAQCRRDVRAVEKKLRASEQVRRALEGDDSACLRSPTAFAEAVRVAYARAHGEHDRFAHPLRAMRVPEHFLASARALTSDGSDLGVGKIVEVCMQVACDRAKDLDGRQLKRWTESKAGPNAVREADGAQAWRCYLQHATASARRLHYWVVPGPDGATVEFDHVAKHDDDL